MVSTRSCALVMSAIGFSFGFAGCSVGSSSVASSSSAQIGAAPLSIDAAYMLPEAESDAKKNGLIYVADYTDSDIRIYPLSGSNQKQIGLITGTPVPEYLNVDRWHNLYVVEFSAGTVSVYPRGKTKPSLVLTVEPNGAFPNAVSISHSGEVAVGQFADNGIEFYHKGATTPFNTVVPPSSFGSAGYCAYDADGNLYVIGSSASHSSHLGEIVGGGSGSVVKDFGAMKGITNARGVQVDASGDVAVFGDDGTLNAYAPHSTKRLSTESLQDPPSDGPQPNGGFSFTPDGHDVYLASALLNRQNQAKRSSMRIRKEGRSSIRSTSWCRRAAAKRR
jgi:hypothetical protein